MNYTKEQIESLYKAINAVYEDNLEFLEKIDNRLYKRIISLSEQIQSNSYQNRYELEFIEGSFNIFDKKTNSYLYDMTLDEYNQKVFKEVDLTLNKAVISDLAPVLYNRKSQKISRHFNNDVLSYSLNRMHSDIFEFRKAFGYFKLQDLKELKKASIFIFFGTLLGQHLLKISQKVKARSYLITEESLEIFRLSLFTTEYKILSKYATVYFCIEEDELNTIAKYEDFIVRNHIYGYIFKFYSTLHHSKELISRFSIALYNKSAYSYDHYKMLNYAKFAFDSFYKYPYLITNYETKINLPILILAPGPSLRKNIKFVKKNINNFIILAFGASIKILCEEKIKPDIVISVDPSTLILEQFPKNCDIYRDSIAFLSVDSHPEIFKLFKKQNIFVYESIFRITSDGIKEPGAVSVGDITIFTALNLGFNDIYLLGTDLAYDIKTGSSYDTSHVQGKQKLSIEFQKNVKKITLEENIEDVYIKVKGNFEKEVYTDRFFYQIIKNYTNIINRMKKEFEFNVYNLNNGAYIKGAIPTNIKNIKLNPINKNIKKILKNKYKKYNPNEIKDKLTNELNLITHLIYMLNLLKNYKIEKIEEFELFCTFFLLKVNRTSKSSLTFTIIINYFRIIVTYILYYFNNKDLKFSKNFFNNKIKPIFIKQVRKLLKDYKKVLLNGLK